MSKVFHHTAPLPRFTSLGCYSLAYVASFPRGGKDVLCCKCATEETHRMRDPEVYTAERAIEVEPFIHWEGEPLTCEECNEEIESAYGVPDEN